MTDFDDIDDNDDRTDDVRVIGKIQEFTQLQETYKRALKGVIEMTQINVLVQFLEHSHGVVPITE